MQIFRESESLFVYDTDQFDDYSKHESTLFDVEAKPKKREKRNSRIGQKAFDMGVRFYDG